MAGAGAMSLRGVPVNTNRGVRGKVTNILLIIDLYFHKGFPANTTLLSLSPAWGDRIKNQTPTPTMPFEVANLTNLPLSLTNLLLKICP